jgi:adenylate cyclase
MAHIALGLIALSADNDSAGVAGHLQQALALDPTNLWVLGNAAVFLGKIDRSDESLALHEAAVRRDPVNVMMLENLGTSQRRVRRYDAAIPSYRTLLSLSPRKGGAHFRPRNGAAAEGRRARGAHRD